MSIYDVWMFRNSDHGVKEIYAAIVLIMDTVGLNVSQFFRSFIRLF